MGYLKSFRKVKREVKAKPGRKVSEHFEPLIDVLESQIDMFDEVIKLMQAKYQTDLIPPIFNNYLFFRLVFKDILSLIGQLQKEQAERDKNLTARSLALHLYEFLADAQDFLGPKMKGGLAGFDDLPNHDLLTKDLYKLKEIYKGVKDKTFKDLADIRNNTSAHKDQNPLLLRRKIRAISSHEVQVHAVLCTVLFLTIVHFQNNVMAAIMQEMDAKLGTNTAPAAPYKTVDRAFRGLVMIIGGTEPRLAEVLSDLTQEEIKKLVEMVAYLEKKDPMFPASADKGVSARKPGLRRRVIDQIRKYWSKQ